MHIRAGHDLKQKKKYPGDNYRRNIRFKLGNIFRKHQCKQPLKVRNRNKTQAPVTDKKLPGEAEPCAERGYLRMMNGARHFAFF
jgi:hypothetical protein